MQILKLSAIVALFLSSCQTIAPAPSIDFAPPAAPIVLLIHGGAGSARPDTLPEQRQIAYRAALSSALAKGYKILEQGGSSLDAVQVALMQLEDDPLFNAGRGSVLTATGEVAMDASIMDGATLNAGAVAGVHTIRHPIKAARAVMEQSPHVMLAGDGAEEFANIQNLEMKDPSWFITPLRQQQLQRVKTRQQISSVQLSDYFGTIGAVALDRNGNLAAATSTGGMTNKKWDRIGDSPIIGAGTYADNQSCAVSATGWGEYFIRATVARDICARMQWNNADISSAADQEIAEVVRMGASGGVLVLSADGNHAFSFSTSAMFRGVRTEAGEEVAIFTDQGDRKFSE